MVGGTWRFRPSISELKGDLAKRIGCWSGGTADCRGLLPLWLCWLAEWPGTCESFEAIRSVEASKEPVPDDQALVRMTVSGQKRTVDDSFLRRTLVQSVEARATNGK